MTAAQFGRLLQLWGLTQGGTPHYSAGYVAGQWRFVLAAGGTSVAVTASTYDQAIDAVAALVQRSVDATVREMAS